MYINIAIISLLCAIILMWCAWKVEDNGKYSISTSMAISMISSIMFIFAIFGTLAHFVIT